MTLNPEPLDHKTSPSIQHTTQKKYLSINHRQQSNMASLPSRASNILRHTVRRLITSIAWLLADWMGWHVATAVYPPTLRNKTAIVTGANSGIGLETTKALLQQGATMIMACRNLDSGHAVRQDILADTSNYGPVPDAGSRLKVMHLDYEDLPTIRRFADEFRGLGLPLHVLVNNAGVHLMPFKHIDCGLELNIAANYVGPFYLTQLLLDDLKASAPSRVVNMGSVGEVMGLRYMAKGIDWDDLRGRNLSDSGERPYALAKTYLLMGLTRELARRLEGSGVDVIAVHPGVTNSSWYKKADDDTYLFSWVISRVLSVLPWLGVGQPTGAGAISSIYASIAPELTGITSSMTSHGFIDSINRALFGGRLVYFGPSYLFNLLLGPVNASRCIVVNPYCYNKAACKKLYEKSLDLIDEVERELALPPSQAQDASVSANSTSSADNTPALPTTASPNPSGLALASAADGLRGGAVDTGKQGVTYDTAVHGALKQRQQAAAASSAPLGADE